MQDIMIIGMVIMTAANIVMLLYIAQCLGKITAVQEQVYDVRTQVRERHTNVIVKCNSIEHMHRAVVEDRVAILKMYNSIKIQHETTQKASNCLYKYEYTNSTV